MQVTTYADAASLLRAAGPALRADEVANSLVLGISLRLAAEADRAVSPLCLKTVDDRHGPVLAAVMAPPYKLVVSTCDQGADAASQSLAKDLLTSGWVVPGVQGPTATAWAVAKCLSAGGRREPLVQRSQHLLLLHAVDTPLPAHGRLRSATQADVLLVAEWWYGSELANFGRAARQQTTRAALRCLAAGDVFLWEVGRPVSMAVRTSPTWTGITVARVFTPPAERGHGYATVCVSELSRVLLHSGWAFCVLYVDAGNDQALRVYQRVGYRKVCGYQEIALVDPPVETQTTERV